MKTSTILPVSFIAKGCTPDFSQLSRIQLNGKTDFSNAEAKVLECANYLTSTPMDRENLNREYAENFLLIWMSGTSDFTFNLNETVCSIIRSNLSLIGVYFACATKFALENRDKARNKNTIIKNALLLLLNYCKNPKNKVDQNDLLKAVMNEEN
ncbi:hypothetical protein [Bacteroides sedimenti]|uniref:Uncharacterized protein n=1 Tax=Bacteroides sedimenti TaxID=2136147 RepID=A0ABN6Z9K1_9BACE